jgi:hypothetical protein
MGKQIQLSWVELVVRESLVIWAAYRASMESRDLEWACVFLEVMKALISERIDAFVMLPIACSLSPYDKVQRPIPSLCNTITHTP